MLNDFSDKAVLVTGGTKGIGLATGLAFGREGARVFLTHKWGSADEDEVRRRFAEVGAPEPRILEADVIDDDDTAALMERIHEEYEHLEVFISNVCITQPAQGLASYRRRSLLKSVEYSAWPLIGYLQEIRRRFGRHPRYVVGMSSDGANHYFSHYEFVAASKAVMETMCRYLSTHLAGEDLRINMLRTRNVLTDAVEEIFGPRYREFLGRYAGDVYFMKPDEIGDAALALCSGLMDAVSGQVLQVDKGMAFADTVMRLMDHGAELGLEQEGTHS